MIIHPLDNVEIRDDGHKYALRAIRAGENVVKYGMPIGHATRDIAPGEHVHVHNVATNLGDNLTYAYEPDPVVSEPAPRAAEIPTFKGYGGYPGNCCTSSNLFDGWRNGEKDDIPYYLNENIFQGAIDLLFDAKVFTSATLMKELNNNGVILYPSEIEELLNLRKGTLDIKDDQPKIITLSTIKPNHN